MSWKKFDENCKGCRPAIKDLHTGEVYPDEHPVMQKILAAWALFPREVHEAFHRCCCLNSRDPKDMRIMMQIADMVKKALAEEEPANN